MNDFVVVPDYVCWTHEGYSGTQDFDDIYLGVNRTLPSNPIVKLNAMLRSQLDTEAFMDWWAEQTSRGVDTFLIEDITLFGKQSTYGVRQIKPLSHSRSVANKISVELEILFDSESSGNTPPEAINIEVSVEEDSKNNYIELSGVDAENNELEYEIISIPAYGVLNGVPPALSYIPNEGYVGEDGFTYIVKDVFNQSSEATVIIDVGLIEVPNASFLYVASKPYSGVDEYLEVSGNYFYKFANEATIHRGTSKGIPLQMATDGTSDSTLSVTVYSNDNIVLNPELITSITVLNWGERENYQSFVENHSSLASFTVSGAIGSCKGKIFNRTFFNCPIYIPLFDTVNGIYFKETFRGYGGKALANFNLINGIYFQGFLKESLTENTQVLDTQNGEYMQEFFMDSAIKCCAGISTIKAINKLKMFYGISGLVNPSTGDQSDILQGTNQPFVGTACKMSVDSITQEQEAVGTVTTVGGTATATGIYKVNYSGNAGVVSSFVWTLTGGTIISGQGTDTVTVSDTIGSDETLYLACAVTDNSGVVDSGNYQFTQRAVYTYLMLDIPKQYSQLNLRSFIDANNPSNKTEIVLTNTRTNCSMTSGDLSGLNVKLINTGRLEGFARNEGNATNSNNNGLNLTSELLLDNTNGFIAGCGGEGGNGGKGANNTYSQSHSQTSTQWKVRIPEGLIEIYNYSYTGTGAGGTPYCVYRYYASNNNHLAHTGAFIGLDGKSYRRASLHSTYPEDKAYYWTATWSTTEPRTGGTGGNGGNGLGYGATASDEHSSSSWRTGTNGTASSPSGGNSGGKGGSGGWWGAKGYDGSNGGGASGNGQTGYTAGKGIVGISFLKAGSVNGLVYGGTV